MSSLSFLKDFKSFFFFFLHFTVVISTVFWSAFIFILSLCRVCLSVWVQAHTNTFRAQSQVVVLALHLTWDRLSWWWRVQQAAGLQGPVHSLILRSLSLRSAGTPEGHRHTLLICGRWDFDIMLVADTLPTEPSPHSRSAFIFISHFPYLVFFF